MGKSQNRQVIGEEKGMLINERKDVKLKQNLIRNSGENTQNGK